MYALKCCIYALQFVQLASMVHTAPTDVHIVAVGLLQAELDVSVMEHACLDVMTDGLVTTVIQVH